MLTLKGYCSCLFQNLMGGRLTELHTLKVWCHYAPLGKLYNLNVQIVFQLLQSKLGTIFSDVCCAAHTFCHRKNLCLLQLLHTSFTC